MLRQKNIYGPSERTCQSSKNITKGWRDSQLLRYRVQNTGYQDAPRIGSVWSQNRGKSEGYEKWNKEKCIGNQQWREGNQDSNRQFGAEERNIQPKQNEETRIQNNEDRLGNLWNNFKCSNIQIIEVPEGEEKDQEIENLFEKIMENFPNLVKEIDFREVQEAQRVPKKLDPRRIKIHHNYITQRLKIRRES